MKVETFSNVHFVSVGKIFILDFENQIFCRNYAQHQSTSSRNWIEKIWRRVLLTEIIFTDWLKKIEIVLKDVQMYIFGQLFCLNILY